MESTFDLQLSEALDQLQGQKIFVGTASIALTILLLTWVFQKRARAAAAIPQLRRLPPGPREWLFLGSLHRLGIHPYRGLHRLSMKHGPLMFMHLGSLPTVVASNADMAQAIYKTNDQATASRPVWSIPSCLFYDQRDVVFAPYGSNWRQLRKIITLQLFTKFRTNHFQHKRQQEVHAMIQSILKESQAGNVVRMDRLFLDLAMNIMTQIMWSQSHCGSWASSAVDHDGFKGKNAFADIIAEFFEVAGTNSIGDYFPTFKSILEIIQGLNKRAAKVHQRMDQFLSGIVSEHKQRRSLSPLDEASEEITNGAADDFVDVLLKHSTMQQSKEDEQVSETSIKALLTDMIVAGSGTTAVILEWALAELLRRPDLMSRTQAELTSVVGSNRLVNEADIPNLTYLNAVLKETLRLHPPAPLGLPHFSTADCKIGGYHVPAKCLIFVNIWAVQRDPATWERSWDFDPERFLADQAGAHVDWQGQDFHFIPFGSGRRQCPAINHASPVLHLALAQVVHSFDWSLSRNQKLEDLDMAEKGGHEHKKAVPLTLLPKPRLSHNVIFSESL